MERPLRRTPRRARTDPGGSDGVEGGRSQEAAGQATFGIVADDPGPRLTLRELTVRAGVPGDGAGGAEGTPGRDFESEPDTGEPPRGAVEDDSRQCLRTDVNVVAGGAGSLHRLQAQLGGRLAQCGRDPGDVEPAATIEY